jgi:hypothetical protein
LALFAGVALLQTGLARGAQLNPGDLVIVKPTDNYNLYRYEPETGAVSTLATGGSDALYDAYDVALGDGPDAGRVWVAVGTIEQVDLATGLVTTTAAGPSCIGITYHNGLLYATALDSSVRVYDPATGALINTYSNPAAAELLGIRYDSLNDRMVLSDFGSSSIEAMTLDGRFSTSVSGQGLSNPYHVALESNGNILVSGALIQRIDVHNGDSVSTVASGPPLSEPLGVAVDSAGQIYTANYGPGSPPAGYGAGDLIRMNADGTAITNLGPVGSSAGVYSLVVVPTGPSPSRTNSSPAVYYGWPRGQTVLVESNATLAVFASGAPPLSYQWMFNGTNLADNGRVIGSRSNLLAIAKVLLSDTGSYQATVTNAYGSATSAVAVLNVVQAPTILAQPTKQTVDSGANVAICVQAIGTPSPAYQWQFDGTNLTDSSRISGSQSDCLGIANAVLSDAGDYQVIVTNAYGSLTSGLAVLGVNQGPLILVQPQSQNVPVGASATITVIVSGWPPPSYQWQYNGTNLEDSALITGSQTNSLTIAGTLASDAGDYDIVITNAFGSITSTVAVLSVPNTGVPTNVAPTVIWAREGGGPMIAPWEYVLIPFNLDEVDAAAPDGRGGVYVAGLFSQYARFDDIEVSAPPGYQNFFLVKYDAQGKAVWGRNGAYAGGDPQFGQYQTASRVSGLAASPDGGVVVAVQTGGEIETTIDGQLVGLDPNTNVLAVCPDCSGYRQPRAAYVLAKYDANGNRSWSHVIYSANNPDTGELLLAVDSSGNIFLVGLLNGVADIDGQVTYLGFGSGVFSSLRFDPAGQFQGLNTGIITATSLDTVTLLGLDVDAEGNLYVTGEYLVPGMDLPYTYTISFGSVSLSVTSFGASTYNSFTAKLDATGAGLWAQPVGGEAVKADGVGNVYVAGTDYGSSGAGLLKLDPYGREIWEQTGVGGWGAHFACDADGNVVVTGPDQSADFQALTGQTVTDPFGFGQGLSLVAFTPSGQIRWAKFFSAPAGALLPESATQGTFILHDSPGSWLIAGNFTVRAVLDGITVQTPWPGLDWQDYVARLVIPATNDLPIITAAPEDTTVFETRTIQLQAAAASSSPLGYQWLFNGLPISYGTSNTLAFTNATVELSGKYSVSVSNANGSVTSAPAAVTVLPLTELGEALNATNLQWRLGGLRGWQLDTNVTHDGVLALRTDYLFYGVDPIEDCWIETTLEGPGALAFWWKASTAPHSPGQDDGFQFILDGVQQFAVAGDLDWQSRSLPLPSGSHTARWYWSLPSGVGPGNLNLCWLDQVTLQPMASLAPQLSGVNRLADGRFQFTITTSDWGATLGIEACSDLTNWLPIAELVATNGVVTYTNPAAVNFSRQFYRAVLIGP